MITLRASENATVRHQPGTTQEYPTTSCIWSGGVFGCSDWSSGSVYLRVSVLLYISANLPPQYMYIYSLALFALALGDSGVTLLVGCFRVFYEKTEFRISLTVPSEYSKERGAEQASEAVKIQEWREYEANYDQIESLHLYWFLVDYHKH